MAVNRFAAINIGAYELTLKIYELAQAKKISMIDNIRYVMELGKETYTEKRISFGTIEKMCEILYQFSKIMKQYQVHDYEAVATSVIREAENAEIIIDRIKVRTGLNVRILSNSEQRYLAYKALWMYPEEFEEYAEGNSVILDVGAGSIQISLMEKKNIVFTQNIKIGSMRIRELLYNLCDNIHHFDHLLDELINNDLQTFKRVFGKGKEIERVIATGDQITLFSKDKNTGKFQRVMTSEDFMKRYEQLNKKNQDEIAREFQVTSEQAGILIPCSRIYGRFVEVFDAKKLWMPGTDICDGMAVNFGVNKKKISISHDFEDDIRNEVKAISKRFKANAVHIECVRKLAMDIFDVTKKVHGMSKRERLLLELAVLLHDCGKYISILQAAESAYNIIMATEIIGLSQKEHKILAEVVKYNTREIEAGTDLTVVKLTAILRVANALDRSHKQKFADSRFDLKENILQIQIKSSEDLTMEKGLFLEKAEFFEEVYGVKPVIKQRH